MRPDLAPPGVEPDREPPVLQAQDGGPVRPRLLVLDEPRMLDDGRLKGFRVAALDQNPIAREGWNAMTPTQRRGHLMGVFYYRTPEARARRLQKAMEAAKNARSRKEKLM